MQTLGSTGLPLSRIAFGMAALGRPGYITLGHADELGGQYDVAAMESRSHAVLDVAWQAGVRYFDAARSYGRAEEFLGVCSFPIFKAGSERIRPLVGTATQLHCSFTFFESSFPNSISSTCYHDDQFLSVLIR